MAQSEVEATRERLLQLVKGIYDTLKQGEVPEILMPSRNRDNIVLDQKFAVWRYGDLKVTRSARYVDGAEYMLKSLYMIEFILEMIRNAKTSTLREMYYISEGWKNGKFGTQDESNIMAEDLEVMTALLREDFRLRPEENGASVIGNLTLEEKNRKGEFKKINCKDDVGEAGYSIPYNVDNEKVR
ncbi:protein containing Spo11/DNA topoisomerase VI, subunit A, partial [mine drainage metagenome]